MAKNNKNIKFIDLFAGIGGTRLGYERAGAHCVFTSEWDRFAQTTYKANYKDEVHGDINKIETSEIPDFDILLAGFPCQPFSLAGVSKKTSMGITKDVYDKKHQEYADKLQLLEIELSEYRKADYDYQTTVATAISLARRAQEIFDGCSEASEKRAFLNLLLQNPTVNGKKLDFTLASPFNLVLDLADVSSGSVDWTCSELLVNEFRRANWSLIQKELEFSGILNIFSSEQIFTATH